MRLMTLGWVARRRGYRSGDWDGDPVRRSVSVGCLQASVECFQASFDRLEASLGRSQAVLRRGQAVFAVCTPYHAVCRQYLVVWKLTQGRGRLSNGQVRPANGVVLASTPTRRSPMARFPRSEPEIAALAMLVTQGPGDLRLAASPVAPARSRSLPSPRAVR